jgi:hypothetical protein
MIRNYGTGTYSNHTYLVEKENLLLDFQLLIVDLKICALSLAQHGFLCNNKNYVSRGR